MSRPIAVFYHCALRIGVRARSTIEPDRAPIEAGPLAAAPSIVRSQIEALRASGLLDRCERLYVGVNGGLEDASELAQLLPNKAIVSLHGLDCRNELRTLLMLERFVEEVSILDRRIWSICYHHSKGASHPVADNQNTRWRICMEKHVIRDWRRCVEALEAGHDAVGAHYLSPPITPGDQRIFAGNFFWASSRYLRTLPSLFERERIRISGIESLESRFEAEVYVGNSRRPPRVLDLHPRLDSFEGCGAVIGETIVR